MPFFMKRQLLLVLTLALITCSSFAQDLKDMAAARFQNFGAYMSDKADKSVIDAKKVTTETYGDWYEGMMNTVQQSAKYLKSAR